MFCRHVCNTISANTDRVTFHQFPKEEKIYLSLIQENLRGGGGQ